MATTKMKKVLKSYTVIYRHDEVRRWTTVMGTSVRHARAEFIRIVAKDIYVEILDCYRAA